MMKPGCLRHKSTFPSVLVIALLLPACLAACSGSDGSSTTTPSTFPMPSNYGIPLAGCEQQRYSGCDITDATCEQAVFDLVKCVRNTQSGTLPPVTTITAAEYRAQLTKSANENTNAADLAKQENALVMLGLASKGDLTVSSQVDVLVNTVGAYYTSNEKKVYVIRPDTTPTAAQIQSQTLTLAHEFVHALQDEAYDLTQYDKDNDRTSDSTLSASSVVEGEAILYETMLRAAFDGLKPEQVDIATRFANAASYIDSNYADESPVLIAPRLFPYFYGGPYVNLVLQAQGRSGVDALFASPPPATLPFIVSQGKLVDTPLSPVTDAAPTPVAGSALFYEDTFGAWLTYEYLNRISGNTLTPLEAVAGWRGDHIWIYSDSDATVSSNIAVVWRVRFATASDVDNFVTRTNSATVSSPAITAAWRKAFTVNGDAVVVAVTGTFNQAQWEQAAREAGNVTAASSSASGNTNTAPDSKTLARSILTPAPQPVR